MSLRFSLLALAATALAPMAVAQSVDCDNYPMTTGAIPADYLAECVVATSPVFLDAGPSDLSGGVWNNAPTGSAFVAFPQNAPNFNTIAGNISQMTGAFINAGDFAGSDRETWYFADNMGNFATVSVSTGTVTSIGTYTAGVGAMLGMSWDPATAKMYVSLDTPSIGELDLATGAISNIVPTDGPSFIGIAHDNDGTLFGVDIGVDALFTVDATTGVTTEIGPLGVDANFGQGIDFDEQDGTLYYYPVFVDGGNRTPFSTIDVTTGAVTEGQVYNGKGLSQMGSGSSLAVRPVASEGGADGSAVAIGSAVPNPSSASARVPFSLEAASDVTLAIYDVLGRQVAVIAQGAFGPGSHDAVLDASALSAGTYVARLQAGSTVVTRTLSIAR